VSQTPQLSVVIPVYNEGPNITKTLESLRQYVPVSHEVLVVYDRDHDDTLPVVRSLMPAYGNLRLIKNAIAPGPSGALRTGFQEAKGSLVLVAMADLCDDFSQIKHLLSLVPAEADIACPSRYCRGGSQQLKRTLKLWAPKLAGRLLRWIAGMPTYDPTNSFKLYSAAMLTRMSLSSTVSFSVTLEIMAKAHCLGYRILEVPTAWTDRQHGKSNFNLKRALVSYLPWFCLAMLRGRLVKLPQPWLNTMLVKPPQAAASVGRPQPDHE
jgi:dolichol-phosphate mannosyltransferase